MTVFSPQFQPAVDLIYGILKQVQNDTLRQAKGKLKTQNYLTARPQDFFQHSVFSTPKGVFFYALLRLFHTNIKY